MALLDSSSELKRYMSGGAQTKIIRARDEEILHDATARQWLRKLIEGDANAHGATIHESAFNKVVEAICARKLQACFLTVSWDGREPQYAGGAMELPTILTEWNGKSFVHYPAIYSEDTYVVPELSEEFRARTKTTNLPQGIGLGTHFTLERIKLSASGNAEDLSFGKVSKARISENAIENVPMIRILKKLGATTEVQKGTILELNGNVSFDPDSPKIPVITESLGYPLDDMGTLPQRNLFLTHWSSNDGSQRIVASFTEAISTFTGEPVVRVQFTSNGYLPKTKDLKHVIAALITAGRDEIVTRDWGRSQKDTLLMSPNMYIHALNAPEIVSVLKTLGTEDRFLGSHLMTPIIANYENILDRVFSFEMSSAKAFIVTGSSYSAAPENTGKAQDRAIRYLAAALASLEHEAPAKNPQRKSETIKEVRRHFSGS